MSTGLLSTKALLFLTGMLFVIGELNAKENADIALEESNLNNAVYCMDILEIRTDLESSYRIDILRNECYIENFLENAPNIGGRREA